MRFNFVPREEKLFDFFERQAEILRACQPVLDEILRATRVNEQWANSIKTIEEACDAITGEVIRKTGTTFITPIDREDIFALATAVDDVVDLAEEGVIKIVD